MEIARLFQVMPVELKRLPLSEFRLMARYYRMVRNGMEDGSGPSFKPGPNDVVVE